MNREANIQALSVVIPCLNSAHTLPRQLAALAAQEWAGTWEVIVADNGSADSTVKAAQEWAKHLPSLTVVDASQRRGAAHARNVGAAHARYDHVLWLDADDQVQPGYLDAMSQALGTAEFCCGTWSAPDNASALEALPPAGGPARTAWWVDPGFLDAVGACNGIAVSKEALGAVGGFAVDMTWGSEDTAFCWALQLAGYPLTRVDGAVVAVYARDTTGGLWRQQANWGTGAVDAYRRFRHVGAPRSSTIGALSRWAVLIVAAPAAMVMPRLRYRWLGMAARRWGRLRGSFMLRTLYL